MNKDMVAWMSFLSQGNPGAIRVCLEVLNNSEGGPLILGMMAGMKLRGAAIWVGYKDYCGQDILKFIQAVKEQDPKMMEKIKAEGY